MINKNRIAVAIALAGLATAHPLHASERKELEALRQTTFAILDALVQKGILSEEVARGLVKDAERKGHEKAAEIAKEEAAAGVVRVPYIPEVVKREIREQIRQEVVAQAKTERWGDVNAVPEWVDRLKWEGDLRVRYQGDLFADQNLTGAAGLAQYQAAGMAISNAEDDRQRARVRARLGLTASVARGVAAGLRITTGNTADPVSTNQTLGTSFNKYSLVLDRAFLKLDPWEWLSVSGGRLPNPFFASDLVWDEDLNFEGLAASFTPWARSERSLKPFAAVGVFPLQEVETSPTNSAEDKWLYAAQLGLDWRPGSNTRWRFGLAYYDYENIQGIANTPACPTCSNATAPQYRQKGNSVFDISTGGTGTYALAADYRLLNLTAAVDLAHFDPIHVVVNADVVKNIGYDQADVASKAIDPFTLAPNAAYGERTLGWQARVSLGWTDMRLKDNWQIYLGYKHLERDAVLDAFTDSDFRLGGTDAKGYYLGGLYALANNSWLSAKWQSADEIDGLPFGVDVLQVDFNAKF